MVMLCEPLQQALRQAVAAQQADGAARIRRIYLSPQGEPLTDRKVQELAGLDGLVLLCGRYEGVDERLLQSEIEGGTTIADSAQIFMNIISGKGTEAQNNVVCANAAMAIATVTQCTPLEGFQIAKESLLSGKGLVALNKLKNISPPTPKGGAI